mgnify:CR=1 FL=1
METPSKSEALAKALTWRFAISIPGGIFITYLWIGELATATSLMIFMNILFTFFHYLFEMGWPKLWDKISYKINKNELK